MSRVDELFAPRFLEDGVLTEESQKRMAEELGADSLRYLPVDSLARAIDKPANALCQACVTGNYPSPWGQKLYQIALDESGCDASAERTYETSRGVG